MKSLFKLSFSLLLIFSLGAGPCAAPSTGVVAAGPEGPVIARIVTRFLEEGHYIQKPVTAETSRELMKLYLKRYDPSRLFFTTADINEFNSRFGVSMAPRLKSGDVGPAYFIFNRFIERLEERVGWVHDFTLSTFTFTSDGSILIDRSKAPWPAGKAQAYELWRKRVEFDMLQEKLDSAKPEDWAREVRKTYDRLLYNYKEFDQGDVLESYLSALAACYDPHSSYMAPSSEENFDIALSLSLVGIGVVLQPEEGYAKVMSIIPGGPAAKSGSFHPNDRIEAVAQGPDGPFVEAVGMRLDHVVKLIRGEIGTVVRLRLIPADALDASARITVTLVREKILLRDQQAKAQIILIPGESGRDLRLGVINLPSFYFNIGPSGGESTTRDVKILLDYLKQEKVSGLILDLRGNGGGSLEEAVNMTGLFIGDGPVVQVRDSRGGIRVLRAAGAERAYDGPMVVLDSRFSASASEIFSAALKDYGRAVLVGEKSTFGKGTVQAMVDLDQYMPSRLRKYKAGGLKLTMQKFYRASGGSTQNRGVAPDISLPSLEDYLDVSEASLPNALGYDQIPPALFKSSDEVLPQKIARLRAASGARVAASPDFKFVREDIALYLERKKEKTISLNYAQRRAEREKDEARKTRRNKERAARKTPPLSITDIALQDISSGKPLVLNSASAMEVAYSSGAFSNVPVSSAAPGASVSGVEVSSPSVDGAGYARAPAGRDFFLEEAARILADLIAPAPGASHRRVSQAAVPASASGR
ncbi:MAG: hypothetical protein AUJ51_09315 [Elusimicrobia bacterium CG1_02_56_21]|nr:MAG: hypothetical protein AUJ51_09315 [Elusimicrobia bacterium CG1_02_56_21]